MKTCIRITVLCLITLSLSFAGERHSSDKKRSKTAYNPTGTPTATLININRAAAWYSSSGAQERHPGSNSGLTYPRLTATAMYTAGLLWGGKFNDGRTPALRVNGQSYNTGTRPGAILGLRTGNAEDPLAADVRIWRIRKDYSTADLRQDAAEINGASLTDVTAAMIQAVRDQYATDWAEWPWLKGAPFYDVGYLNATGDTAGANNGILDRGEDLNHNGILDSGEDSNSNGLLDAESPGIANADQVIWYVCNDIVFVQPWACPTSGIEEQTTIWGYATASAIGNAIYKRFRLIYKGVASTPANATIDSMYLCQWSDPDVGDSGDDFVACDTAMSLGYAYNAGPTDVAYAQFGLAPPAIGNDFYQGPIIYTGSPSDTAIFNFKTILGAKNLPMTSFIYFAAGGVYSDPPFNANGSVQWYQMLRGLPPTPQGPPDPPRIINPSTGQRTSFWLSGDPVTDTGWRDGTLDNPGDRRYLLSSGPFTMAVGDTQEIVVAVVAGLGGNHRNSISVMKFNSRFAQEFYRTKITPLITDVSEEVVPTEYQLEQNFPNPFNPTTEIRFGVGGLGFVSLRVIDVLGREVATLVNEELAAGRYERTFNAAGLASGVYMFQLKSGNFQQTKKMLLVR